MTMYLRDGAIHIESGYGRRSGMIEMLLHLADG